MPRAALLPLALWLASCSSEATPTGPIAVPGGSFGGGSAQPGMPGTPLGPATPQAPPPAAPPTAEQIPERYDQVRELLRQGRPDDAMAELQLIARAGAAAREILAWARDDEDLLVLRDRTDYQALMYPDGDRPAGQVPVSKLYALGGPARLTHTANGPAIELRGLGVPPTEGERWQPVKGLAWSAVRELLSSTRALSSAGEDRTYLPAPEDRDLTILPLTVRQGGVAVLHEVGWWRPREGRWLVVIPYQLGGPHGGLGMALYAPAPGGVQLVAATGEIALQCDGRDALVATGTFEELRLVAGCAGEALTVCRVRWEGSALRSACGGVADAPVHH